MLIRHRLRADIADDLAQALNHSVTSFGDLQAGRLAALDRQNAPLADLDHLIRSVHLAHSLDLGPLRVPKADASPLSHTNRFGQPYSKNPAVIY